MLPELMEVERTRDRSAFGLAVLGVSIGLAVIGNTLLRGGAWGANLPLWVLLTGACGFGLLRQSQVTLSRAAKWLALPIVIFSVCFIWRDSDALKIANGFALMIAIGVLAQRAQVGQPVAASVLDYTGNLIVAWFRFTADFAELVANDIDWRRGSRTTKHIASIVRGLVIALPLVIVFGALFASADAAFNSSLAGLLSFDASDAFVNLFVIACIAMLLGGLFRRLLWPIKPPVHPTLRPEPTPWKVQVVEFAVALAALDALFVAFVGYQIRFLFAGSGRISSVAGLTFAEYARNGFFELTAVAALSIPVLIGAQVIARRDPALMRWFVVLGALLTGCVFVILASALSRMNLYVDTYGLSELRLFTTIFMGWLAVVLVWLSISFLLKRRCFSFGALIAGYAFILLANAINPDGLIAAMNLRRGHAADLDYLSHLSLDAAPAIRANAGYLPRDQATNLLARADAHWSAELAGSDWKSLNASRLAYFQANRRTRAAR